MIFVRLVWFTLFAFMFLFCSSVSLFFVLFVLPVRLDSLLFVFVVCLFVRSSARPFVCLFVCLIVLFCLVCLLLFGSLGLCVCCLVWFV